MIRYSRFATLVACVLVAGGASALAFAAPDALAPVSAQVTAPATPAQSSPQTKPPAQKPPAPTPPSPQSPSSPQEPPLTVEADERVREEWTWRRRPVVKVWQDFTLPAGDSVRHVAVVFGDAVIDGRVEGDVVVVFGDVRLGSSAFVRGSVSVTAGDVTVAPGSTVRGDFITVGGVVDAPATFTPGGEHVTIGSRWLGDRLRSVSPWLTRGLAWGRLIVPDIDWVWSVVILTLLISAGVNLLMHGPVTSSATTLAMRPFSTFFVGILALLVIGPLSLLLAASVVGIVVLPFLWCGMVVAWLVGKVAVARWLGRGLTGGQGEEGRAQGLFLFLLGSLAILVLYAIPVLGIVTWSLVGVFGLGAATLTFMAGLRRERPAPPPVSPAPVPPSNHPTPTSTTVPPPAPAPSAAYVATPAASVASEPLPVSSPAAAAPPPIPPAAAPPPYTPPVTPPITAAPVVAPAAILAQPRASLLERLLAIALDAALVLIALALLDIPPGNDGAFPLFFFGYTILFWAWKGTTVGGIICNLRITRTNGEAMRFIDALVRGLSTLFSVAALGLGMIWVLRDDERQSWQDKIAGTFVVRVPRNWPV